MILNWNQFIADSPKELMRLYSEFKCSREIKIFEEKYYEETFENSILFILRVIYY